jgi:Putative polyhydroxyalkanoic acid system protein (PHA_gran_rgn)
VRNPIAIDIPHQLGKAAARGRLDRGIGKIGTMVPGGGEVKHDWDGDTMAFTLTAMGQTMHCTATVFEKHVHAIVDLPPMLALFAGKIREALSRGLPKLLA